MNKLHWVTDFTRVVVDAADTGSFYIQPSPMRDSVILLILHVRMHLRYTKTRGRERDRVTQWTSTVGTGSDITNSYESQTYLEATHTRKHYLRHPSWMQGVGSEAWTLTFYGYLHPVLLL